MVLFEVHQRFKGHFFNELRVSFKYAYFFVNKTRFVQVLRIHAYLSKRDKYFVTGRLIYCWKQDG